MIRTYSVVIKFPLGVKPRFHSWSLVFREDSFIVERPIMAENRASAVGKAIRYFWQKFVRSGLSPCTCLTVDDPYNEVVYERNGFHCQRLRNRYLTDDVINRLVTESHGFLMRDDVNAMHGHPLFSVRKRKRNIGPWHKAIAPNIYKTKAGTLFYSVVTQPQRTVRGIVVQKAKVKLIRLSAKTLADAIEEIKKRQLRKRHLSAKFIKRRSLKLAAYLGGTASLSEDDKQFFAPIIDRYGRQPRSVQATLP